jgi:hypothetical protein
MKQARQPRFQTVLAGLLLAILALMLGGGRAQAQDAQWLGRFWNNRDFAGSPALTRWDNTIDFNWAGGSPDPAIASDNFTARWTRRINFPPATYRFTATMDDGMRVWVDGRLIMDHWSESQEHTQIADVSLNGNHDVRVDYFEAGGMAVARLSWAPITTTGGGGGGGGGTGFVNWRGQYFNNITLTGTPSLVRDDRVIDFDWGLGSPGPEIFNDFFSARWTKTFQTVPGLYRFFVTSDDGARVWVNGQLILNNWRDQGPTRREGEYWSPGGPANVTVEYYEAIGGASIRTGWLQVPGGVPPATTPPTSQCPTQPSGLEGVVINASVLNVRSGPGTQFPVIGRLTSCQRVPLTGFRNQDGSWVMIWLSPGVSGWVNSSFMQLGVPMNQLSPI